MLNDLIEVFEQANNCFLERLKGVSERTLCGALMLHLYEAIKRTNYQNYFVDVEYNRNGGKLKTIKKQKMV